MAAVRRVPADRLFVSEPNPRMFGNPPNPSDWQAKGWTNQNWLKSRFHFSFAEYRSSRNSNFGVLRVMNDDLVQPRMGFGEHPHSNMEILTYVVKGELTHQDSMGSKETLGRGSVQFMTAGRGVYHSERNEGGQPCRFIQSWIVPREHGLKPNYGSYSSKADDRADRFLTLAGPTGSSAPIEIAQDASMHVAELSAGKGAELPLPRGRQAYMLCVEGSGEVAMGEQNVALEQHDAAELRGQEGNVKVIAGDSGMHVLVFTMRDDGSGRGDL